MTSSSSSLISFDPDKYFFERHECPVCWSPLIAPVFQCFQGHLVCDGCLSQLTQCPICRDEYPSRKIRARGFEEVIKQFSNSEECSYQKFGCPSSLHHEDLEEHEMACKFRRPKCPAPHLDLVDLSNSTVTSCSEYLEDDKKWMAHLRDSHHLTGIDHYEMGFYVEIFQKLPSTTTTQLKKFRHTMFLLCQGQRFYIRSNLSEDNKFLRWAVTSDDPKLDENKLGKIKAVIKFVSSTSSLESTGLSIKWRGPIVANKEMKFSEKDKNFMSLPIDQLIQYSDPPNGGAKPAATSYQWKIMVKLMRAKGTYCQIKDDVTPPPPPTPITRTELVDPNGGRQFPPAPVPSAPTLTDLSISNIILEALEGLNLKPQDPLPPIHFHHIYGPNLLMSSNKKVVVVATNSDRLRGIVSCVFSDRPVGVGEEVLIRLSRHDQMYGSLEVGFTNNNPVVFGILSEEAQETKFRESVTTLKLTMQGGRHLNFSVGADGRIHNEVIGPPIHPMQMIRSTSGRLDPTCPLWAFVQLSQRNDQVSLIHSIV